MFDLARSLAGMGHDCMVATPDANLRLPFEVDDIDGFTLLRVRSGPLKRINLVRRAINEILLSARMWRGYKASPLAARGCDGVVFYSPTIFLGRFASRIKALHGCPSYLILRDIFPDWAVDLGVMRKGPHYWIFRWFAQYQYSVADTIAVESPKNKCYFDAEFRKVEVLHNWIDLQKRTPPNYKLPQELYGKTILVYAGNIGVAQDMDNLIRLGQRLSSKPECVILLVGSGSERDRLGVIVRDRNLRNVVFHSEIAADQLRGLLHQCHVGLISLDKRLRTHNIPGKLLSYLEAGLPVLASVNVGNDLKDVVELAGAGIVVWNGDDEALEAAARRMVDDSHERDRMASAARRLCETQFSSTGAANQILNRLNSQRK